MLRATCAFEENVVILLLSLRHSVPWQDTTSVTPCTLQTLWIIDVLWGRTSARGAPHITDLSGELNFWCMQKGSFWEMNRKTSPHKVLNLRQPVFIEFRSCHWVTFARLERECFIRDQRLRGCLSPYFWRTWTPTGTFSAGGPLTLSWAGSLLPTSSCTQISALFYLRLIFYPAAPFPKIHRNIQSQRFIPLCRFGRSCPACSAVTRMGSEGSTHSGIGTPCDSMSCASLGKQTTKSGTAWNKMQLSIAVVLQRNYDSEDEAII